ncbi:actin-binding, cofilin/tropomyosin type protein [Tanacetum coccineum]
MEYESRVNERQIQTTEEKTDTSNALDASSVIIESNGTESKEQDTSSRSGNDAHVDDADIRPIYDEEPMAEVQMTADDNVSATGQQHTEQPEFINEGEVDQNAEQCHDICPLPAKLTDDKTTELSNQSLESENVCLKKTVAQCQKDFAKLEAHCINLELQMQNNVLKSGQQSQFLKEKSNEAKVKNDIDVTETINIELEHSVAKLLAENEQLHKEKEHLKQTYKDLFDSIKSTRVQTKNQNDSLMEQLNKKSNENADVLAQIQKKGFAIAALKNELRKLTGNSVNTKFAKPSILGKPVGQPLKNQSVVRQPTAFKSERPRISKPRFASQVDVNNDLSKPVTTHHLPKRRESAPAKPHYMIATSSSRERHSPLANKRFESEPQNGSNADIPNQCKAEQALNVNAVQASVHKCQMVSAENNTSGPFLNVYCRLTQQFKLRRSSAELGIQDHNNEQSSSKLVPKVVPLAVKTATSRQELELLFHHQIAMLRDNDKYNIQDEDKLSSPEKIDNFLSVGLPSKDDDTIGFEAVRSHMMHEPFGSYASDSSCMDKHECMKGFPKSCCASTYISAEGWPHYARPNNGREANVGSRNIMLDNLYVVPHNMDLLAKYDCYINVEWCNQGSLVKYLFSYITKGSDQSTVFIESKNNNNRTTYQLLLNNDNEIGEFLNCRYISTSEACWKIFDFDLQYGSIAVERLPFHEEDCNRVYFRDNEDSKILAERISSLKIKFPEWMHDDIKAWNPQKNANIGQFFGSSLLYLSPDVMRTQRCRLLNQHIVFTKDEIQNYALLENEFVLNSSNRSLSHFSKLSQIDCSILNIAANRLIADERMYNIKAESKLFFKLYSGLNRQQKHRTIISKVRLAGKVILQVASSGIASLLLPGGQTSHSRFCIPIDLDKDLCCAIVVTSDLAELIKVAKLIIWYKAPLQHRHAFEVVDRTFRDIRKDHVRGGRNRVFGGKVFVLGGDFRQILLVITNGTGSDVITLVVNKLDIIRRECKVYVLSINIRLRDPMLVDSDVD